MKRLLVSLLLAFSIGELVAAPWEGPRKTEDDLRQTELASDAAAVREPPYKALPLFGLHLGYADLFDEKGAEVDAVMSAGIGAASRSSSPGVVGIAAVDAVHNGMNTSRNDALFAVSIGLDFVGWLTRDRSQEQVAAAMKRDFANLKSPSLWMIKVAQENYPIADRESFDKAVRAEFLALQDLLLSLPIRCDQAYYRATNPFGSRGVWGRYVPGIFQFRMFTCGHDDPDLSVATVNKEVVSISVQKTNEGKLVSRILFHKLDQNSGVQKVLNASADRQSELARVLYTTIRPRFGDEWKAVFTAPNKTAEWKVFVAAKGIEAEFNMPDERRIR